MKKSKKSTITTVIVMFCVSVLLIGGYYYFSNKEKPKDQTKEENTQVEKLINKDLKRSYPATPREVVKLYSRIMTCYYNFDLTEEELEQLVLQSRCLFDEELNKKNKKKEYIKNLQAEIESYRQEGKTISEYKIEQGSSIHNYEKNGRKYATVLVEYTVKSNDKVTYSNEQYILRQDDSGNYKILGWQLVDDIDFDDH